MNKSDIVQMSLVNMLRRKTRTFLTITGVVIGTSSIVVMLSLGLAMDKSFQDQLDQMGSLNVVDVYPSAPYQEIKPMGPEGSGAVLDDKAIDSFEKLPGVEAVMPQKSAYMRVIAGRLVGDIPIIGIKPELLDDFDFETEQGRLLAAGDKNDLLFGVRVADNFMNPRLLNQYYQMGPTPDGKPRVNLLSSKLLLTSDMYYGNRRSDLPEDYKPAKPHEIKGVGIIKESGNERDYQAYMNIETLEAILREESRRQPASSRDRVSSQAGYEMVKIKVQDIEQVEAVQKAVQSMGFQANSLLDMLNSMKKASRTFQAILGGIGAVSLLVAAIGITNTMIMSIYERTREIGVMKVLGADLKDIGRMFLFEAGMIGLLGGGLGLGFSYLVSWLLNSLSGRFMGGMGGPPGEISVITPLLSLAALVFSALIGLVAGYFPARRAMHLSVLEAIRSDQ